MGKLTSVYNFSAQQLASSGNQCILNFRVMAVRDIKLQAHLLKNKFLACKFRPIDPMQKWLPSNYSFVRIQNSLTNLVRDNKFFTIFVSKTRLVRLI